MKQQIHLQKRLKAKQMVIIIKVMLTIILVLIKIMLKVAK